MAAPDEKKRRTRHKAVMRGGSDSLSGKITYRDGTPAAGVPLIVELPDGTKKGATTDDAGRYRFEGVRGAAKLRLVDGMALTEDVARPAQQLVAVNSTGAAPAGAAVA